MAANTAGQASGSGPTQYAVPPARGEDAEDYTSFVRAQALYSIENLPDIIYQRDIGWNDVNYDAPPLEYNDDGSEKIDQGTEKQFRTFDVLPDRIATVVEGWRVECWMRLDTRIEYSDILMRMIQDNRPTANNLNMVRGRFRVAFWLRAWESGGLPTNQHDGEQFNMLTPQQKAFAWSGNSTRTMTPGLIDPALGEAGGRIAVPQKYIAAQEAAIQGPILRGGTRGARQRLQADIANTPIPQRTTANYAIQHGRPSIIIPYREPGPRAPRPRMGRMGRMGRSRALPARPHPTRAGAIRPPTRGGPQLPSFLGTATLVGGRSYTWGMANSSQTAGAMQSPSFPRDPSSRIYLGRRPWVRGSTPSQGVPQSSDHQVASDSDSVATNVRRQDPATRRPVVGSNLRQEVSQADDQSVAGTGNMSSPPNPYHQQHNQPLTESRVPDTYYQRRNEPLVDCRVHTDGLQSVSRKRGRTYEMEDHPVEAPAARPSFQPFSNPSPYYQQRSQQLVDPRIPTDGLQNVRGEGGRAYENEDHPIQASAARPSFQPLSHPNAYHQQRDQPMIDPRATNSYYQQRTQPQVDPRVPTDGLQGVPRDGGRTHENQDRPIEAPAARKTSVQPFSPTESFTALYDDNGQDLLTFQRWAGQRERYITQARAEGREHTLPANVDSDECLQRDWAEKCAKRRGHFGW